MMLDIGDEINAEDLEDFYITTYITAGFNLVNYSEGVKHHSTFHVGNTHWLRRKYTPEARDKIGAAHVGNKYFLGRKHTEQTKAKISVARKGKNLNGNYCRRGHAYTPQNTYVDHKGHRYCRTCKRLNHRTYLARKHER
jgi:NUMOD3 motif